MWLIVAGVAAWYMPWTATASAPGTLDFEVDCPAAPVDLLVNSQIEGWANDTTSNDIAAASAAGVCRTSAWWRTMLGTVLVAVGLGRATRGKLLTALPARRIAPT